MSHSKKIVLLGHFGVGKTSLIRRYVDQAFSEDYIVTLGVQVKKKTLEIAGIKINIIIWDLEGNTSVSKARKSYLLGSHGFVYVFDVSRPETYEHLSSEIALLRESFPGLPIQVIGNKKDLIVDKEMQDFFKSEKFSKTIFTSAKEDQNVADAFIEITKKTIV